MVDECNAYYDDVSNVLSKVIHETDVGLFLFMHSVLVRLIHSAVK